MRGVKPGQTDRRRMHPQQHRYSAAELAQRRTACPKPEYPEALPVSTRRADIAQAIAEHQVVIVCGETGSGKTTQLPKILLELGRGIDGLIGHTQPRRIAARATAARIAQELKTELGGAVGHKIRFRALRGRRQFSPQSIRLSECSWTVSRQARGGRSQARLWRVAGAARLHVVTAA